MSCSWMFLAKMESGSDENLLPNAKLVKSEKREDLGGVNVSVCVCMPDCACVCVCVCVCVLALSVPTEINDHESESKQNINSLRNRN